MRFDLGRELAGLRHALQAANGPEATRQRARFRPTRCVLGDLA
jgi:hypothetical protein